MEKLPILIVGITLSALVALLGRNRKIGYGWSFFLCLCCLPIAIIVILFSKKNEDVDFVEIKKENEQIKQQ